MMKNFEYAKMCHQDVMIRLDTEWVVFCFRHKHRSDDH